MATKKQVRVILENFSDLVQKKEITIDIIDAWYEIFKSYSIKELQEAAYRVLDECSYFPKISEMKKFLKSTTAHNRQLKDRFTCPVCKNYVSAIVEGVCWDCQNGLPLSESRIPVLNDYQETKRDYSIAEGMRCNECGHIGIAIKEPLDSGIWRCRQCYTGLTVKEIQKKFRDLIDMLGGLFDKEIKKMTNKEVITRKQELLNQYQDTKNILEEDIPF